MERRTSSAAVRLWPSLRKRSWYSKMPSWSPPATCALICRYRSAVSKSCHCLDHFRRNIAYQAACHIHRSLHRSHRRGRRCLHAARPAARFRVGVRAQTRTFAKPHGYEATRGKSAEHPSKTLFVALGIRRRRRQRPAAMTRKQRPVVLSFVA